ncbi:MAG: hypothetical protein M9890_10240 [Thermomicrobiales bacterium]|nr:hypothetical protein [Thermomicrobiales bacterium]
MLKRPAIGRVRNDEDCLAVVPGHDVAEERAGRVDDITVALPAGERRVDVAATKRGELCNRDPIEFPVVAFTEPRVLAMRMSCSANAIWAVSTARCKSETYWQIVALSSLTKSGRLQATSRG